MTTMQGKVALITGSASGLGLAIARRFRAEGAQLVLFDRDPVALPDMATDTNVATFQGDVRSIADNEKVVSLALQKYGRLDALVANAGIYDNRKALMSYTPAELEPAFQELFAINVLGYLLAARTAAPALAESRGSIVFTGSISGTQAGFGGSLYVAAKHAIHGLTRQLALELAPSIRVNGVAPGFVPTNLRGIDALAQGPNTSGPAADDQLLKVIATPDDYTDAYVFLASAASRHVATGTMLTLDGGSSLLGPRR